MDNYIMDSFKKGTAAEELAATRIRKAGWEITDVRKDTAYQMLDIDYICDNDDYRWSVDIKTDKCYKTGNYFFETVSNVEREKAGWVYTSAAEYILIVYRTDTGYELHVINMYELRKWLSKNIDDCRVITNGTRNKNGQVIYHSQGIIVNRQRLNDESDAVEQILSFDDEEEVA